MITANGRRLLAYDKLFYDDISVSDDTDAC